MSNRGQKRKKKRSVFSRIVRFVFKVFIWGFLLSVAYILFCKWVNPPFTITQLSGVLHGEGIHRNYIRYDKMGSQIKLAVMASEDQLFPTHNGFDYTQIQKAIDEKKKGKRVRGASTISQQTAKNVFLWQHGGWIRKGLETYFTFMIEMLWSKQRILEVYLNVIEMGPDLFGIGAAAQIYFQKPPAKLTANEAAKIAACLPNPKTYSVVPLSRRVRARFPQIVRQMRNIEGRSDIQELIR